VTGWALSLGIFGAVVSVLAALVTIYTFYASGPVLRVKLSQPLYLSDDGSGLGISIEITNSGRSNAVLDRVYLNSRTSTAWISIGSHNLIRGEAVPATLKPTQKMSWTIDFFKTSTEILSQHPGEIHKLHAVVLYGARKASSRQCAVVNEQIPRSRVSRWRRFRSSFASHASVQFPIAQPLWDQGLQTVEVVNERGFSGRVTLDLLLEKNSCNAVVDSFSPVTALWMWPGRTLTVTAPLDAPDSESGTFQWRLRQKNIFGSRREQRQGFMDRSSYQVGFDLVANRK
jgi:hypothetical protein